MFRRESKEKQILTVLITLLCHVVIGRKIFFLTTFIFNRRNDGAVNDATEKQVGEIGLPSNSYVHPADDGTTITVRARHGEASHAAAL